jgi:DNA repair exonuclease SbcCD ATPase subunit
MELKDYRFILNKRKAEKSLLESQLKAKRREIKLGQETVDDLIEARRIVAEVAKLTQIQFKEYVENLVTIAIQSVFPEKGYKFVIEFDVKRNKSEAQLLVQSGDKEPYRPEDEQGGSIVDIISFALRIVLWSLQSPRSRNVLILDEPFRFTGKLVSVVGNMMKEISQKLGLQIIMVTHSDELAELADRSWEVKREGDESKLYLISGEEKPTKIKRRVRNEGPST